MIGGISGVGSMTRVDWTTRSHAVQTQTARKVHNEGAVYASARAVALETPVQPVAPARPVHENASGSLDLLSQREGADPAEMAVRMRMQYVAPTTGEVAAQQEAGRETEETDVEKELLGLKKEDRWAEEEKLYTEKEKIQAEEELKAKGKELKAEAEEAEKAKEEENKSARETMEEEECETCENRKYQDGSDDPGVSFKTPGHIDANVSSSVVRGHEMEHVNREQAKARLEDRKVVGQSVTLQNAICPECGKVYVSGGTTRTTTMQVQKPQQSVDKEAIAQRLGFDVVA